METRPDPARVRLAEHMDERRRDLGRQRGERFSWDEVAVKAGLHRETLRNIRLHGRPMRDTTKDGIEDALQWERGSIDAILQGGDPTPAGPAAEDSLDRLDRLFHERKSDPSVRARLEATLEDDSRKDGHETPQERLERLDRLWRLWRDDQGERGTVLRGLLETWGDSEAS
ncbi:hypothetical protein [Actinomadura litoris]|uniref:Uncharacterized protein n=1 Tax=Actinomadura litoris TaxID=2678616 RepID=A0A7K1LAP9_9ACTN|nr:hypothetical protein [Actinomadura litoris]MUN41502.1 hypothetical protein [Actinomadura litoris]